MRFVVCALMISSLVGCASDRAVSDPAPAAAANAETRSEDPPATATTLFVGPRFFTGDPDIPEVDGVSVDADGRIVGLYPTLNHAPRIRTVTLDGAFAVPGLHDAHLHLAGVGQQREILDLRDVKSLKALRKKVKAYADAHPDLKVIYGRGWDQSLFKEKRFPTSGDLGELGDRLVLLRRVDGHAALASKALLDASGINAETAAPEGGRIERDKSGAPTGLLVDNAMALVSSTLPAPTHADLKRWLELGIEACADAGLVSVHDMAVSVDALDALLEIARARPLPLRVFVYLDGADPRSVERLKNLGELAPRVSVLGVKLFADGAMGSRGAALLEDYSDEQGNRGLLLSSLDELSARAAEVQALGYQVAIHAIGDRGNRTALEAIARAQGDAVGSRHRIEHAQLVHPDDFDEFLRLGVVASMQPTHATSDMRWVQDRVGTERMAGAYAWRTFYSRNIPLAFGSDAPVESERPVLGLHAATTRKDANGKPEGGWLPEQKLFVSEAIEAFTAGAAFAVKRERDLGLLKPGMSFDVTVFDKDPRQDSKGWLGASVVSTALDGEVRLAAPPSQSAAP